MNEFEYTQLLNKVNAINDRLNKLIDYIVYDIDSFEPTESVEKLANIDHLIDSIVDGEYENGESN